MKEKILLLRSHGKSYNQICSELKCSKSLVSYYCGQDQCNKMLQRQRKGRMIQHPYKRKLERFLYKSQKTINKTIKTTILTRIYKKLWLFNGGKTTNMITLEQVISKFGENPLCYLTGEQINIYNPKSYQFDHKIPVSKGGANSLDNMGIATSLANRAKSDMTPQEFINLCKSVLTHNGYKIN